MNNVTRNQCSEREGRSHHSSWMVTCSIFEDFLVADTSIVLCATDGSTHDKTYGHLTLETVRRNGRIIVVHIDEHGQPGAALLWRCAVDADVAIKDFLSEAYVIERPATADLLGDGAQ
ncbi:hypothetical protein [Mesorhizobium sp. SP-1A]|uniref:hypothetical protein n=1 Tax=Mesorhizobium sp. SP-1A TaxID=3077840 RepID=UPI0028F6E46F|nr:hypothetical protein [Mesorhizobium sp. SP-1A]